MEVNKRCNLKCKHCDFWTRDDDDRANYLTFERKREILFEYAAMNPRGRVVICGGEPMLDIEDYFALTGECRRLGLTCLSVINGTRIRRAEVADRMIAEGPHEISISLNSHRKDQHDETRGVRGAFEKAVTALRLLVEARKRNPQSAARIYVMGLIYKDNYRDLEGFYDFVLNDIGADKLKLNFLQPAFGQAGKHDDFFAEQTGVDADELESIIKRCDERFALGLNPVWSRQVGMYFRSVADTPDRIAGWGARSGTAEHICNTYERNVMINHYGVAKLCFSTGFRGERLTKPGDLRAFWEGANDIRVKMQKCNAFCGISHSVRREASTIEGCGLRAEHDERHGVIRPRNTVLNALREASRMARARMT